MTAYDAPNSMVDAITGHGSQGQISCKAAAMQLPVSRLRRCTGHWRRSSSDSHRDGRPPLALGGRDKCRPPAVPPGS